MTVVPGRGISILVRTEYVGGQPINVSEINIDPPQLPMAFDENNLNSHRAAPGQVLMATPDGNVEWKDLFDSNKELREQYPPLEEAWGTLMEALAEYELVKKLILDHDK